MDPLTGTAWPSDRRTSDTGECLRLPEGSVAPRAVTGRALEHPRLADDRGVYRYRRDVSGSHDREPSEQEVVAAWLRHHGHHEDEDFWAWDEVSRARPNMKWRHILAILDATDDESAIGLVGAGPLENLLANVVAGIEEGDDSWVTVITTEAVINPRLCRALAAVWPAPFDPPELWARLDAAIGSDVRDRWPEQAVCMGTQRLPRTSFIDGSRLGVYEPPA
jgi:hypothetical protein